MTLVLVKLLVSICVVLGLSWVAEHVNARIAGIVSGMPLGAVLVLSFVGLELGPGFAAESAGHAVPSIVSTVAFAYAYYFGSRLGGRWSPLISSAIGLACYLVVAGVLSQADLGLIAGLCLTLATLVAVAWIFHSHETNRIASRVPMTLPRLLFRAGTAGVIVAAITGIADTVGPLWSGLLVGFPMTFLPFLLVIHLTYSADHVRTIIRNFPLGLVGLLTFLVAAHLTIPTLGVASGILAGLAASLLYLSLLAIVLTRLRPAPAAAPAKAD